ncbi:hypothetical protein ONE63_004594 [Megalurothrips usitatus]|uniref:XK-related protein n=1 Tax=Megalurothrips usitatus TaxID=439358 RepID=A0AAV7X074_9NEOP|nr:hypothetical protein ONE63_004594 [Megalurothrips usitatus]
MGCFRLASTDQTDYPPLPMRPSHWDIFCLLWAIVFHLIDLGTDINVALHYYNQGEIPYAVATIVIVLIPSIVTSLVSYRMYVIDGEKEISYQWNRKMTLRLVMLALQLAPVLRYIDSLKYAYKSRKAEREKRKEDQERFYKLMLKEDADVALLRVFECFLEAAPQQVLQVSYLLKLYYLRKEFDQGYDPILSVASSFIGMAICLMTYQKSIRFVQDDKDNISCVGSVFVFFWHFFISISRILMLSAMVYISWKYALISMVVHWFVMTMSLSLLESHDFCSSASAIQFQKFKIGESMANFLFSSVLGLVYIFTYITPGEGSTCFRYTGFYVICLLENIVGAAIWYNYSSMSWLTNFVTGMCVIPFVLGCLSMIIYHWKFHPNHYVPPSIMPQRRQIQTPESTHLAPTPSPKFRNGKVNGAVENGAVAEERGQGDVTLQKELEMLTVKL